MPERKQFAFHRICRKSPSSNGRARTAGNATVPRFSGAGRAKFGCSRRRRLATIAPHIAKGFAESLQSSEAARRRFIDSLKMLYHVANIGDARSLAIHPATSTHLRLSKKERAATGVTGGCVRRSIGIQHPDDIIADIGQALDAAS